MYRTPRRLGFTLIEVLVVVSVIAVLIAVLLPALSKSRDVARQAQSQTNVRSIITGLKLYGNDNKSWMPGVNHGERIPNGGYDDASEGATPYRAPTVSSGNSLMVRYAILLNARTVSPALLVSPNDPATKPAAGQGEIVKWTDFGTGAYSYAMLDIQPGNGTGTPQQNARLGAWSTRGNPESVLVSDRGLGSSTNPTSIWNSSGWSGVVGRHDTSTSFVTSPLVTNTKYGARAVAASDDLFADSSGDTLMLWQ